MKRMPSKPDPAPLIERFFSVTMMVLGVAVAESLTLTPFVPAASIEPKPAPLVPSMVRFLVMVTVPNPPGSRQSISPLSAVFEIAPANVLQGAVRLQGFTSSPTPETHVLVACACATADRATVKARRTNILSGVLLLSISVSLSVGRKILGRAKSAGAFAKALAGKAGQADGLKRAFRTGTSIF